MSGNSEVWCGFAGCLKIVGCWSESWWCFGNFSVADDVSRDLARGSAGSSEPPIACGSLPVFTNTANAKELSYRNSWFALAVIKSDNSSLVQPQIQFMAPLNPVLIWLVITRRNRYHYHLYRSQFMGNLLELHLETTIETYLWSWVLTTCGKKSLKNNSDSFVLWD